MASLMDPQEDQCIALFLSCHISGRISCLLLALSSKASVQG